MPYSFQVSCTVGDLTQIGKNFLVFRLVCAGKMGWQLAGSSLGVLSDTAAEGVQPSEAVLSRLGSRVSQRPGAIPADPLST